MESGKPTGIQQHQGRAEIGQHQGRAEIGQHQGRAEIGQLISDQTAAGNSWSFRSTQSCRQLELDQLGCPGLMMSKSGRQMCKHSEIDELGFCQVINQ